MPYQLKRMASTAHVPCCGLSNVCGLNKVCGDPARWALVRLGEPVTFFVCGRCAGDAIGHGYAQIADDFDPPGHDPEPTPEPHRCYKCDPLEGPPFQMMVGLCYRHAYELEGRVKELGEQHAALQVLLLMNGRQAMEMANLRCPNCGHDRSEVTREHFGEDRQPAVSAACPQCLLTRTWTEP